MKYCINCGTLLEDTHEVCIGCGLDVTIPENVSMYPPEMQEKIEIEKKTGKKRVGLIATIIGTAILLLALIVLLIWYVSKSQGDLPEREEEVVEEAVEAVPEEPVPEATEAPVQEEIPYEIPKVYKTDVGSFYNVAYVQDAVGNTIFSTVYPEDFPNVTSNVDYGKFSTRYPETITFVTSDEQSIVQFTYISPQHFWHRKSTKGKSRNNERDIFNFMTFYTYDGVQPYLEALINTSYTDIKKLEFIEKVPLGDEVTSVLMNFSDARTAELSGDIGDYARIGSDTQYAVMGAECEASIYRYMATSRQDNIIYMDFYIPVIANTLSYSTAANSDSGDIIEWVIPCIAAFEAGNEELHNKYQDAFYAFIYNSKPNREFFFDNYQFGNYLTQNINDGTKAGVLDAEKLQEYHANYNDGADIGSFNTSLMEFLASHPSDCRGMTTEDGYATFTAPRGYVIGYFDRNANKLFISPDNTEYPGDTYEWLFGSDEYVNPNPPPPPEPAPAPAEAAPAEAQAPASGEQPDFSVFDDDMGGADSIALDGDVVEAKIKPFADAKGMTVDEYISEYGLDESLFEASDYQPTGGYDPVDPN